MIRADLHIHTVLSPCGDLEMTPLNIVTAAKNRGLDLIGITDHNSTLNALEICRVGKKYGLNVLCGAEITTKEEVHVLAFAEPERIPELQSFLEENIIKIPNNPEIFGYQLAVTEDEEVTAQIDYLLINSIDKSLEDVGEFVRSLGGIFIPAHIDKHSNSIYSQLGFMPFELSPDAAELSATGSAEEMRGKDKSLRKYNFIRSSDAHYPQDIGKVSTLLDAEDFTFESIRKSIISKASPPQI